MDESLDLIFESLNLLALLVTVYFLVRALEPDLRNETGNDWSSRQW
jgi:hypothetical protein